MILITSGNSRSARHLVGALRGSGRKVRLLDISPATEELRGQGVEEVIVGDMDDPAVVAAAVDGVEAVVHIGPPMHPRETAMGQAVVAAAERAGVERFVLYSVIHPQLSALVNHQAKLPVEDRLLTARLRPTILRPQHYMQNIVPSHCLETGAVPLPYSAERRLGFVDMEDVAAVATKVLLEEGHDFATYDLCGNDHLSTSEIAELIGRIGGRPLKPVEWTVQDFFEQVIGTADLPDYTVDGFHRLFLHYDRHGIAGNPNVLGWLLGRAPTSFEDYVRRELSSNTEGGTDDST